MVYTCPVIDHRAMASWLALYRQCYGLRAVGLTAHYERVALPREGGIQDQYAKDLEVLMFLDELVNEILAEKVKHRGRSRDQHTHHREEPDR